MEALSRRTFAQYFIGGCACAVVPFRALFAKTPELSIKPSLRSPDYSEVQLLNSKFLDQLNHQKNLYLAKDNDALLKPFRVRSGLDAPGEDMGGWYDATDEFHIDINDWSTANWNGYIPGHSFGQYVSGLSRVYAAYKDDRIKVKVDALIAAFIPTISAKFFDDYNLPAYTYDKIIIGLIDAYRFVGTQDAKIALDLVTDVAMQFIPEKALTREERMQRPYNREPQLWDETYTLPENLFLAWQTGLGERYKDLAIRYLQDDALFIPLSKGISPFKGRHAYSHVNALNSAVSAYLATGNSLYLQAAINGFDFVWKQSFATGGWGANETLLAADDFETLYVRLTDSHSSFETPCGVYGHFKIARSLLRLTKNSRYGDSMERILYNTIWGARDTTSEGQTFYYADYNQKASKFFHFSKWPCCSGTFIQLAADYGLSSYFSDESGLYLNLYLPSKINTTINGKDVSVATETEYPIENIVKITVNTKAKFSLNLRIPEWAGQKTYIEINGKRAKAMITAGEFYVLNRQWKSGDRVEIVFDMEKRLEPLNSVHTEMVALMYGPLALFPIAAADTILTKENLLSVDRVSAREWRTKGLEHDFNLKPFVAITDETYRLYSRIEG